MTAVSRLWAMRERRPRFAALAGLALAILLAWPVLDRWWLQPAGISGSFRFFDFGAYAGAAVRWLEARPIYQQGAKGGYHGSFLYPPFTVAFFRQFLLVEGFRASALAFQGFSLALLWVGLQLVVGALGYRLHPVERLGLLWAAIGFQPLLLSVKMGQTAGLMGALLCFAFVGLARGERRDARHLRWLSGAFTATGGLIKLAYAPVGAHLLADRDRLAGAIAGGGLLVAFSVAVFGVEAHLTYLDVLAWGVDRGSQARSPALWLPPYFRPLVWLGPSSPLWLGLWPAGWPSPSLLVRLAASAGVAAVAALAGPGADRETFALGVAAFPLLAPLTYTYYLVALLPAALVLLATELERDGRPEIVIVGLLAAHFHAFGLKFFVDVLPGWLPALTALRPFYGLLQPGLWGTGLLAGLALVRVAASVPRERVASLLDRVPSAS